MSWWFYLPWMLVLASYALDLLWHSRRAWMLLWRFYDSPWGAWLPQRWAPWLLGKALGSKGRKVEP